MEEPSKVSAVQSLAPEFRETAQEGRCRHFPHNIFTNRQWKTKQTVDKNQLVQIQFKIDRYKINQPKFNNFNSPGEPFSNEIQTLIQIQVQKQKQKNKKTNKQKNKLKITKNPSGKTKPTQKQHRQHVAAVIYEHFTYLGFLLQARKWRLIFLVFFLFFFCCLFVCFSKLFHGGHDISIQSSSFVRLSQLVAVFGRRKCQWQSKWKRKAA